MHDFRHKQCLITGASSGIGAEFARQLAARGADLVLVARREDRLEAIAAELREEHGVRADVFVADLSEPDAARDLMSRVRDAGRDIDLLVNNAGFGHYGEFTDMESDRIADLIHVNVRSVAQMAHAVLPAMLERRSGAVINVASTAGFQAIPFMAVYAATKAFVLHFSEGLWGETRKQGVVVQALCPGFTKTEFMDEAGLPSTAAPGRISVQAVVESSLRSLAKRRQYIIPGWMNYLLALSNRLVTRGMSVRNVGRFFHPKKHKPRGGTAPGSQG